jgi:large subunit ribosomal protein L23
VKFQPSDIIKKPRLTEKSTWGMNEQGRYMFVVHPRATKDDIRSAVESLYNVKVAKVNTITRRGEYRRRKNGMIQDSAVKMAAVRLVEGASIELF